MWDASQGNNGAGGPTFAYPYTHIVRINESSYALINEPIAFPPDETQVTARIRDEAGRLSAPAHIVIRNTEP